MIRLAWRWINILRMGGTGLPRVFIMGSLLTIVACVPQKVTITSSPSFQPSTIHKLAILPFQTLSTPQRYLPSSSHAVADPTEIRSQFRLPASQSVGGQLAHTDLVKVPYLAAQRVASMVYESLEYRSGIHLVPSFEVKKLLEASDLQEPEVHWKEMVKQIGSRLGVDAVVIGLVRTYRERVGTKIGATPAAVGFEVHLVDPQNGRIYWTGEYYEEQKPMTEDIVGFVERSGAFVTAKELAEYGVHKMMKQFPVGDSK